MATATKKRAKKKTAKPAKKAAGKVRDKRPAAKAPARKKPGATRSGNKTAKVAPAKAARGSDAASASRLIDKRIEELGDWRGETLRRVREIIRKADPEIVEEWKWGTPVWSHDGIVCTGETYKSHVKLTFAKGASVEDPDGLFNSSLEGKVRRAIDIREGERIDEAALARLIRAAVAVNRKGR